MPVYTWDAERVADLTRLWAEGYSATSIGESLGLTRNAIMGKINRLDLANPDIKLPVGRNRIYPSQPAEIIKARARERERRYREKRRAKEQAANRAKTLAMGFSKTSRGYRVHMPKIGDMSKGELRAMLSQAAQNTALLDIAA